MKNRQSIQTVSRNRLFTWLMIGTIFVIIDLAILFYFLRPTTDLPNQVTPASTAEQPGTASDIN